MDVKVYARKKLNRTGLFVNSGEKYLIKDLNTSKWIDILIKCDANGFKLNLSNHKLRMPAQNYFYLGAQIGENQHNLIPIGKLYETEPITIPESGELMLFANDNPHFYWNNFGFIEVRIIKI